MDKNEKARRLELLRKKREAMQKEINEIKKSEQKTDTAKEEKPTNNTTNLKPNIENNQKSTEKILDNNSSQTPAPQPKRHFLSDIRNKEIFKIQLKKFKESLKEDSFNYYLSPSKKVCDDKEIQCELDNLDDEEEEKKDNEETAQKEDENAQIEQIIQKKVDPSVEIRKNFVDYKELAKQKKQKKEEMSNENIREFLEKCENEIKNFKDKNFNLTKEAISINSLFNICNLYYDEERENKEELLNDKQDLFDAQTEGRIVTGIDWASNQNNLFLSLYDVPDNDEQPTGLINLYTIEENRISTYSITYENEIRAAIFRKDNPKIIVGGSKAGQIMLWDVREKRALPEQKSPLGIGFTSGEKDKKIEMHQHPITCLGFIGENNNLLSISVDGLICEWDIKDLRKPISSFVLDIDKNENASDGKDEKKNRIHPGPLCIGINPSITNYNSIETFLVGNDNNQIFNVQYKDKNYKILDVFEGSNGPVFEVQHHPQPPTEEKILLSNLFLSCGADWTTKLWSTEINTGPLLVFNNAKEYTYTVKWHPTIPSVFLTGDGNGILDIWDLNQDKDYPISSMNLKEPINRIAWNNNGKRLAVGNSNGHILLYNSAIDSLEKKDSLEHFKSFIHNLEENAKIEGAKKETQVKEIED